MTYDEAVTLWERERVIIGDVETYTARRSAGKARNFARGFGDRQLDDITSQDVVDAMMWMRTYGGIRVSGLSSTTVLASFTAANQVFKWAVRTGNATRNPFSQLSRPRPGYKKPTFLDEDAAHELARAASDGYAACVERGDMASASFHLAVMIALATGMRRGEIIALDYGDIDNDRRIVTVSKAMKPDGTIREPKTRSGYRSISIGESMASAIHTHMVWQTGKDDVQAARSVPVLADGDGERITGNSLSHRWETFARLTGHAGLRFHDLRHTHATLLISSGVDVKTVQTRLGHSTSSITLDVYAHFLPRNDASAADALDDELFGGGRDA